MVVSDDVEQSDDVRAPRKVLQDLDLPLDLLLLDRFQHFDDTLLVVDNVDAFEDLRVFPSPCSAGLISVFVEGGRTVGRAYRSCALPHSSPTRPK